MVETINLGAKDRVNGQQTKDKDSQQRLMLASNRIIIAKVNEPGSPKHSEAMQELLDIISSNVGALDLLKAHQLDK